MKRRAFVKSSLMMTSLTALMPSAVKASGKKAKQEFYEFRIYSIKNLTQEKLVDSYLQTAAIPALNRLGSKNIGVFKELKPEGQTKIYVLIPFGSMDDFLKVEEKLAKDSSYQQAGAAYLAAPATEPAYDRIESSLLKAFTKVPRIEVPPNKPRIFELRRYESASELAGKKKIEMFNDAGEIDIFKRVGLTPVFFGETIIGNMRPNLTYMLTYDDMEEHDKNWKTFGSDPDWKKISALPEYANAKIVSRITRTFLVPAPFSQV